MTAPPVSICLLTYNRAQLLPATLESILMQSFSDFELLIYDDCSTDNTEKICQEYARHDSRIRFCRNKVNLGMPGNLNVAVQSATGKYIANLHDGDLYRRDLIAKWREALDTYPTAGFVFNAYRTRGSDGEEVVCKEDYPPLIEGKVIGKRLLSRWGSCVFGTVMARREVYREMGWFDPKFANYSDVDMWLRIAQAYDVAYVGVPLMDLMPKDLTRFYAFVHWQVTFWILGIHTDNLMRYHEIIPEFVDEQVKSYSSRRRKLMMQRMLICIKHRRWDRVKEGLAIWSDSDDSILRALGSWLGNPKHAPDWYNVSYWQLAQLSSKI